MSDLFSDIGGMVGDVWKGLTSAAKGTGDVWAGVVSAGGNTFNEVLAAPGDISNMPGDMTKNMLYIGAALAGVMILTRK